MLTRLARLRVPVADYDAPTLAHEVNTAQDWLARLGVPVADYDAPALASEVATAQDWIARPA